MCIRDSKNTVREDMAISLMERMEEVSASPIWTTDNKGFAEDQDLYSLGEDVYKRQSVLSKLLRSTMIWE